jgi:SAM-dependent methyltransferase
MRRKFKVPTVPQQQVYFDAFAQLWTVFAVDTEMIYRPWLDAAVVDLSSRAGSRAVDLGCGTGRFTGLLAERHTEVLGVDIAAEQVHLARDQQGDRPGVRFEHRSLLDVTAEVDGRFDCVLSVNTIHSLRAHEVVLPHLRSLVAPGGRLVVVDLVDPGGWGTPDWQIHNAFTDAEDSYRNRSRSLAVAADLLRLRLHPVWMQHALTNIPLTPDEFDEQYNQVFPGIRITQLTDVITAAYWHAPAQEAPAPEAPVR